MVRAKRSTAQDQRLGTDPLFPKRHQIGQRTRAREACAAQLALDHDCRRNPWRESADLHHHLLAVCQAKPEHLGREACLEQHVVDGRAQVTPAPVAQFCDARSRPRHASTAHFQPDMS